MLEDPYSVLTLVRVFLEGIPLATTGQTVLSLSLFDCDHTGTATCSVIGLKEESS